ncbi:MAG: NUDIX hydrolase [Phycisphaerae bacterium]|nr:NUDIX hydrolase [Phycisphaerae bacterium]
METPANCNADGRRVLFRGAKFDFVELSIAAPGGATLKRQYVQHPGAVIILPILEGPEPSVVLIRNRRHAIPADLYELPAGTLEKGEEPLSCAARELREETGYSAATISSLGWFYTSPGLSDEKMWAFVARGLTPVGQALEPDEHLTVHPTASARALEMIRSGEMVDAKSMLTLLWASRLGLIPA